MSEQDKTENTPHHDRTHDHGHDHKVETTRVIHDDAEEPNWPARLALGVGGALLLVLAFAGWQMQDLLPPYFGKAVPWIGLLAVLLGGAAIIQSVTSEFWIALVAGIALVVASFIIAGRVNVQLDASAHAVFIVDRFTGEARICSAKGCQTLPGFAGASVALPQVDIKREAPKP